MFSLQGEVSVRQEGSNKYKITSNLFKKFFSNKFEMIFTTDLDLSRMSADGTITMNGNKILYKVIIYFKDFDCVNPDKQRGSQFYLGIPYISKYTLDR
jgi:hypothetical protein